jgi:VanZ family protein
MLMPGHEQTGQPSPSIRQHGPWRRFLPLAIWMVLIFLGSTAVMSPEHTGGILRRFLALFSIHLDPATELHWNKFLRKCGHVGEYSVLALLTAYLFLGSRRPALRRRWWIWSLAVVVVFASTDEFHQTFVPGRTGQISDVALDTAGGAAALTLLALGRSIRGRIGDRSKANSLI